MEKLNVAITTTGEMIMRAFDAGWGGAIIKTLVPEGEPVLNVSPRLASINHGRSRMSVIENIELTTDRGVRVWLKEIGQMKRRYPDRAVIASIIASRPELPSSVPAELAKICARAMHEDPAQRYESIEALRLALQGYLEHRGSAQLAARAHERLAELRAALAVDATSPTSTRDDVYRLFGACRSGFHDALSVWPDNEEAREGLVAATVAVAEFELRGGHADVAVRLLGELPAPPPLLAQAREAAAAQAARRSELERLGLFPSMQLADHRELAMFASISLTIIVLLGGWARESLGATLVNRRLALMGLLFFVMQLALSLGGWSIGIPVPQIQVVFLLVYATVLGGIAIAIDGQLWPSAMGYFVGFVVAAWRPEWRMFAMSAGTLVVTINALHRWWPQRMRYTPEERAARASRR